ncbi:hypothetical protein E2562_031470 [Oryza meyeriana var. granulata]|uniref:Uncharacterized protein n=1 Tax=Oryza meyeriana var. granulata TaxID=110450 RepID=A0A6G1E4X6_9ORYZ|nr:hypothetical protein E2562_031470 [Oryza meyeriana var. granulata]
MGVLVEELHETTLAGWAGLKETRSVLAGEEAYLQEGCQQLEALIHAAKAVYDRDVDEVEREHSSMDTECVEAIAAREEATKGLRELEGQREALTILKTRAKGRKVELMCCEAAAIEREEAAVQREGILRTAEARVHESYEDVRRHEEQLMLWDRISAASHDGMSH